jgi:hypothetical protein
VLVCTAVHNWPPVSLPFVYGTSQFPSWLLSTLTSTKEEKGEAQELYLIWIAYDLAMSGPATWSFRLGPGLYEVSTLAGKGAPRSTACVDLKVHTVHRVRLPRVKAWCLTSGWKEACGLYLLDTKQETWLEDQCLLCCKWYQVQPLTVALHLNTNISSWILWFFFFRDVGKSRCLPLSDRAVCHSPVALCATLRSRCAPLSDRHVCHSPIALCATLRSHCAPLSDRTRPHSPIAGRCSHFSLHLIA